MHVGNSHVVFVESNKNVNIFVILWFFMYTIHICGIQEILLKTSLYNFNEWKEEGYV